MGAGGALRYMPNNTDLRARVDAVVNVIAQAQDNTTGYAMAFPMNESTYHENPDYVTSWVTHGLLEAATSGNTRALGILRGHFDWFNHAANLPTFLPPRGGPTETHVQPFPCLPMPNRQGSQCTQEESQFNNDQYHFGHLDYLINQGIIHNTRVALSPIGVEDDFVTARDRYAEQWWLEQLTAKDPAAIWLRDFYPHNYEITAIEAYMDLYQITGSDTYIDAVDGFYDMFSESFMHIGGTVAIKEWKLYPPKSYYIDTTGEDAHGTLKGHNNCSWKGDWSMGIHARDCWHSTGELCGQTFWIKLTARLQRLRPLVEMYAAQIEQTLLNGVLSQITHDGSGIRQFAVLHKVKMPASNISTCCEGQGTRELGSFPEHVFSRSSTVHINDDTAHVLVHMYIASQLEADTRIGVGMNIVSEWPYDDVATVRITNAPNALRRIGVRVPVWLDTNTTSVRVNPVHGPPESYPATRGTYLLLNRTWVVGDTITVQLRAVPVVHEYTGLTQIKGYTRYAVMVGAVLLAVVANNNNNNNMWNNDLDTIVLRGIADPMDASTWLVPTNTTQPMALHYTVKENPGVTLVPYMEIQEDLFDVYVAITH